MKKLLTIVLAFFGVVVLITLVLTYNQVNREKVQLDSSLEYRSALLVDGLREAVEPNFTTQSNEYLQQLVERYSNRQRIAGVAVADNHGKIVAASSSLPEKTSQSEQIAVKAMDADQADDGFVDIDNEKFYVYAAPLHGEKSVVGALVVVQYASYIDEELAQIWISNLTRLFIQSFLLLLAALLILRWIILSPIQKLAASLRLMRLNKELPVPAVISHHPFLRPIMSEVSQIQQSLLQARRAVSEQSQASLEKIDTPWTEERLKQFTKDILKDRTIVTVSNLEPYIHTKDGHDVEAHVPASGLITGIEPVMQATGGLWVAQGSGNADRLVVDEHDKVRVPEGDPKYTLKRVWLSKEEEEGYAHGVADGALYPLCHMAHVRPTFRKEDWEQYKKVNGKFAKVILSEIKHMQRPVIFIQDFQFTLLPRMIKNSRPDATVGLFWHIPWVNAETFSICPWKQEILDGMLGADLLGFHTQLHCNNFIETVAREMESLIDHEHYAVTRQDHVSLIKPFPISVTFTGGDAAQKTEKAELRERLLKPLGVTSKYIGIGVDRLDYIKGLKERFTAVEIFCKNNPELREQFTFVQISAPPEGASRESQEFEKKMDAEVERINALYRTKSWKPIVFLKRHHSHEELARYYKIADLCLVTSLHDGMNLVSKEYVAAKSDESGVLILSQFAGASKELTDALIVNPYNAEQTADAIHDAIMMSPSEQAKRMKKLRRAVKNYNIYRWSAEFLRTISGLD